MCWQLVLWSYSCTDHRSQAIAGPNGDPMVNACKARELGCHAAMLLCQDRGGGGDQGGGEGRGYRVRGVKGHRTKLGGYSVAEGGGGSRKVERGGQQRLEG